MSSVASHSVLRFGRFRTVRKPFFDSLVLPCVSNFLKHRQHYMFCQVGPDFAPSLCRMIRRTIQSTYVVHKFKSSRCLRAQTRSPSPFSSTHLSTRPGALRVRDPDPKHAPPLDEVADYHRCHPLRAHLCWPQLQRARPHELLDDKQQSQIVF